MPMPNADLLGLTLMQENPASSVPPDMPQPSAPGVWPFAQPSALGAWPFGLGAAAGLSACGGGADGFVSLQTQPTNRAAVVSPNGVSYNYSVAKSEAEAARFLLQASLGVRDSDIASVLNLGYSDWLTQQFAVAPGISGWDWLELRGYNAIDIAVFFAGSTLYPADNMLWQQLIASPDPVRRRMALALSELFVVGIPGFRNHWPSFLAAHWWDTLCAHAFGNFRTLLEAVTLHPAMGIYLNTDGNQGEYPATGRVPDENYAREVMQLFTIGLFELEQDGSYRNGVQTETYSGSDVSNLARVFTGYRRDERTRGAANTSVPGSTVYNYDYARLPMYMTESRRSKLEAKFLGVTIAASTPAPQALKTALDTLFNHPNVGPFFGRQMIQRLVTSNPSPAYVARVAAAFNNNGNGVRGDLRAVWRAVLLDDEARGPQGLVDTSFGKLREPMLRFVQWARTFGVTSTAGSWKLGNFGAGLGQGPLRSPSVFNFFRPGYVPPNTAMATTGKVAPEFQLVSEQQVVDYLGAMFGPIRNGFNIAEASLPQTVSGPGTTFSNDIKANYAAELLIAHDAPNLLNRLDLLLTAGQLKPATRSLILGGLASPVVSSTSSESAKLNRIAAAIFLIMASADYLVQK
jgi:uncharacterized protein (DUF1800 family)